MSEEQSQHRPSPSRGRAARRFLWVSVVLPVLLVSAFAGGVLLGAGAEKYLLPARSTPVVWTVITPGTIEMLPTPTRVVERDYSLSPAAGTDGPDTVVEPLPGQAAEQAEQPEVSESPAWISAAVAVDDPGERAMIAIVIDDVGIDQNRTRRAAALPGPLTMSFLPYGYNLSELVAEARANGHEIMIHLPMEPLADDSDPGPNALLTNLDQEEIRRRLDWDLSQIEGYVGVNNHMGSRFSTWEGGMWQVLSEINDRGLLYLDSLTTPDTLAPEIARSLGLPFVARDVFLDAEDEPHVIRAQLGTLERIALNRGYAIGIAHPRDSTIEILGEWLATVQQRGFALVPVSFIVRQQVSLRG